jgi:hypothetical protein
MKKPVHRAKQVQVRDLIANQEDETVYPKPDWYREEIHGREAMLERQRLRIERKINRKFRPAGDLVALAHALMKRNKERKKLL